MADVGIAQGGKMERATTDYAELMKDCFGLTDNHFTKMNYQNPEQFARRFERCTLLKWVPEYWSDASGAKPMGDFDAKLESGSI